MATFTDSWIEWLCKTNFSFLQGASHPHELVYTSYSYGYKGLMINDFDGVYGLVRAYRALKLIHEDDTLPKRNDFQLFYGAEIHFQEDHDLPLMLQDTLVLLARSVYGYRRLCQLLTRSHRDSKERAYVPFDEFLQFDCQDLVAIQPMRGLVRSPSPQAFQERCRLLYEKFASDFYVVLSRHFHPLEDYWVQRVLAVIKNLQLKALFSQDVFFHNRQEKRTHDVLMAMRHNCTIQNSYAYLFPNGERCLHKLPSLSAIYSRFDNYRRIQQYSLELAASCQFDLSELHYNYPKEMLPEGYNAQQYLEELTWQNAAKIFGDGLNDELRDLLNKELQLIQELNFADYFLTVWDIVRWARQQNILCQGRGSAANSAVCFVLGVTSINPQEIDVLFERFMNVERGDPPDIDVDFEHERREEVIHYIYRRYGRRRAAMVANVITFQKRGSLRFVGKALGIDDSLLSLASQTLSSKLMRGETCQAAVQAVQSQLARVGQGVGQGAEQGDIPWALWAELATRIHGFPRHMGIHSGGFIVSEQALHDIVPIEPATMEGRTVIQWAKDDVEALGLFKIDVLSLGALTAIRKCFALIKEHYGEVVQLDQIPRDDAATYAMVQKAETVGTFQIESRAQMSMLPRLRPKCFYDLVIQVAIIRPGPIQGQMVHPFLRRRNGEEAVTYYDPRLRDILGRTLGVPIFQEQVMRIAMVLGNCTGGEANELRKYLSAFSVSQDNLRPMIRKLHKRLTANGIERAFIDQLLNQIQNGFAHYGFPESHAASFALLAYATAYLKCHYPAAFFASLLNAQPMGFYSPHSLIHTAQREGVVVLPICILASSWDHTLQRTQTKGEEVIALRLGFRLLKGVRQEKIDAFCSERHKGKIGQNLLAFLQSARLSRIEFLALAAANALEAYGVSRRHALWLVDASPYADYIEEREPQPLLREENDMEKIHNDFLATGTSLYMHPSYALKLHEWRYPVDRKRLTVAGQMAVQPPGRRVFAFGMVIVRQAPPTAKGVLFITLEDETGFINLLLSHRVYERYHHIIDPYAFLCVYGAVDRSRDAHIIKVYKVLSPQREAEVYDFDATRNLSAKHLVASRNYV